MRQYEQRIRHRNKGRIMANPRKDAFATTSKTIIRNLERAGMEGYFCETSADARELVKSLVPEGSNIAWGGTETFKETGVKEMLLSFGPKHVIVLVGMNKIVKDVEEGLKRVRTLSCPPNAARLHTGTPCETVGVCGMCHEPGCMCCNTVITRHNRHAGRIKVILIAEDLGF